MKKIVQKAPPVARAEPCAHCLHKAGIAFAAKYQSGRKTVGYHCPACHHIWTRSSRPFPPRA